MHCFTNHLIDPERNRGKSKDVKLENDTEILTMKAKVVGNHWISLSLQLDRVHRKKPQDIIEIYSIPYTSVAKA